MSPAEAATPRIFTPPYYARLHEIEAGHWWYRGMRVLTARWLDAELGRCTGLRVLDIGCGAGFMPRWLERYSRPRSVVGIDLDASALLYAGQHSHFLARASALELPFRSGRFDLVHCADVLQHLPTAGGDAAALAECHRVLVRGGLLFLRTNAATGFDDAGGDLNYQRYRLANLRERVRAAGFEVIRSTHANVLPSLIATARQVARPKATADGHPQHGGLPRMPHPVGLNRALGAILAVEAILLSLPRVESQFGHSLLLLAKAA